LTAKISRTEWGKQFDTCWICGKGHSYADWRWLETHECCRGPFRAAAVKEPAAWLRVCNHCHAENLPSLAGQLALKKKFDPENYDRVKVNQLRHRQPDAVSEEEVDEELKKLQEKLR